jgi:hypothetical protein
VFTFDFHIAYISEYGGTICEGKQALTLETAGVGSTLSTITTVVVALFREVENACKVRSLLLQIFTAVGSFMHFSP